MAFTYNLASTDADIVLISQVRLEIGDTVQNAGVLPTGGNLQDEEILLKLTEAGRSVALATTAICGLLARRWALAVDVAVGPRKESLSQVAARWQALAGGEDSAAVYGSFVAGTARSDGYSAAATGDSV